MSSTGREGTLGADGLRERLPNDPAKPQHASSPDTAQHAVKTLNDQESKADKKEEDKRTYGRTPDGTGAFTLARAEQSAALSHLALAIAVAMAPMPADNRPVHQNLPPNISPYRA